MGTGSRYKMNKNAWKQEEEGDCCVCRVDIGEHFVPILAHSWGTSFLFPLFARLFFFTENSKIVEIASRERQRGRDKRVGMHLALH